MKRFIFPAFGALLALALTAVIVGGLLRPVEEEGGGFAAQLDLGPLDRSAVYTGGRLKSFDSFASEIVGRIAGPTKLNGHRPDFVYLDMMLRPEAYENTPTVYVKKKLIRQRLADALREGQPEGSPLVQAADVFMETGRLAPALLEHPAVLEERDLMAQDLIRTAKPANEIDTALNLTSPVILANLLKVIPPPNGDDQTPWISVNDLFTPAPGAPGATPNAELVMELDPAVASQLRAAWRDFARAWRAEDSARVNETLARFSSLLPTVAPELYPPQSRLRWESLYFDVAHMTWVWVLYLLAVIWLLMAVVYRWDGARGFGMGVYGVAVLLHTAAIGLRWWVSGRWPNSNMFEAVTTAFWMGAVLALVLELLARKSAMRNLFALGGAAASMVAMMAAHFSPRMDLFFSLDPQIRNRMPVLHDMWLYIHTNVIIASYALIFMAAVTGVLYLAHRMIGGAASYTRLGGTELLLESTVGTRRPRKDDARASFGAMLDGATMVLIELSFVLLWAGIIMGAIWADHSWGRPWGWDPKEVFALNTFLVYLVLVHVRLKAKDKGLWTAVLSVIGCAVMLFNWLVINFVIAGLHSYA